MNIVEVLEYDDVQLQQRVNFLTASRKEVDTSSYLARDIKLSLPVVAAPMKTVVNAEVGIEFALSGTVAVTHRFQPYEDQALQIKRISEYGPAVGSVGAKTAVLTDTEMLVEAGAKGIVVDVAHGGLHSVLMTVRLLADSFPDIAIIGGNVMSAETAKAMEDYGAAAIRVGIGPGAVCTTRMKTGIGGGQITAIDDCANAVSIPVIADGGIKHYGDIAKALAAGASSVMIGSMFAGVSEGPCVYENGVRIHRGSSWPAEGTTVVVEEKGSVNNILEEIDAALRSSMTYLNARTIPEMRENAIFRVRRKG